MTRYVIALAAALIAASPAAAWDSSPLLLWDSSTIASGSTAESGVLNMMGMREIQVVVDNTSGTALRKLSFTSYLDDGTTTVDSTPLKWVGYGTAPVGGNFDPGRERIYIGPSPASPASFDSVLLDTTSPANTAIDQTLFTEACERVFGSAIPSAGTVQFQGYDVDDTGVTVKRLAAGSATAAQAFTWGPGVAGVSAGGITTDLYWAGPLMRRTQFTTTAAGASNTVRLKVMCKGRLPGTASMQMALPPKIKFSVAAATGTMRVWVFGRTSQ